MRGRWKGVALVVAAMAVTGIDAPVTAQVAAESSDPGDAAIFAAAGAVRRDGGWVMCKEGPEPPSARIEARRDLDGDGRDEAIVSEDGSFCYGSTGMGFALVSQQADRSWRRLTSGSGVPEVLGTRGKDRWPDLSIGGPGFCFPVHRWDGRAYVLHRHEYAGKACTP